MPTRLPLTITINDLRRYDDYDLQKHIIALETRLNRSVLKDEPISIVTWADVALTTEHLIWALRIRPQGWPIAVDIALRAAERALPLTGEARTACEAAITAARGFLAGKVSWEVLVEAANTVVAASAATNGATYYASRATYYAADAAANDAADVAADAAYAADNYEDERARQRADLLELLAAAEASCQP